MFDIDYVARLRRSDRETEEHFVAHFGRVATLMLKRRLRSPEMIQDARQEALMRCLQYFRAGKPLDHPERLAGFVHSMCHNVALEMLRSGTRHPQMAENAPDPVDLRIEPDQQLVNEERKKVVRQVLAQLGPKDRELLQCAFLQEEDKDELCRRFGTTEDYLRVLLHRARNRFRTVLATLPVQIRSKTGIGTVETLVKRKSQSG